MGKKDTDNKRAMKYSYYKITRQNSLYDFYAEVSENIKLRQPARNKRVYYKRLISAELNNNSLYTHFKIFYNDWMSEFHEDKVKKITKKEFNKIALLAVI